MPGPTIAEQRLDPSFEDVWEELNWRGLVHVSTDAAELKALLAGPPITYYCGFDPTAPSLHLGNLVQLLTMRRLQLAGHQPLGLVGGSTGLIGDPRPTAERVLNDKDTVAEWVGYLREQVSRFLSAEGDNAVRLVNNLDWTAPMSAIDFLRDIGKHYRVGTMLKKDAVSARLNSTEGISYTEFSYQILQGMDFLQLHRDYGCVLQTGGSDQWEQSHQWGGPHPQGRRAHRARDRYPAHHQLRRHQVRQERGQRDLAGCGDVQPVRVLPVLGQQRRCRRDQPAEGVHVSTRAEIEALEVAVREEPFKREAQRRLALEVTTLVHGPDATAAAIAASAALFGDGDLAALDAATLASAIEELPSADVTGETPIARRWSTPDSVRASRMRDAR